MNVLAALLALVGAAVVLLIRHARRWRKWGQCLADAAKAAEAGDLQAATQHLLAADECAVNRGGPLKDTRLLATKEKLVYVLFRQGNLERAAEFAFEALEQLRSSPCGYNAFAAGDRYSDLGSICFAQGKYTEAVSLFQKAIESKQQCVGNDHFQLIPEFNLLARAHWRDGNKPEAQIAMARCVALQKLACENPEFREQIPADPELVLQAIGNDEWLLYQGDFEAAVRGFRAKVEYEQRQAIPDAEELPFWEKLAEAEEAMGNAQNAHEAYLKAAERWETILSPGHPRAEWCKARAASLVSPQRS